MNLVFDNNSTKLKCAPLSFSLTVNIELSSQTPQKDWQILGNLASGWIDETDPFASQTLPRVFSPSGLDVIFFPMSTSSGGAGSSDVTAFFKSISIRQGLFLVGSPQYCSLNLSFPSSNSPSSLTNQPWQTPRSWVLSLRVHPSINFVLSNAFSKNNFFEKSIGVESMYNGRKVDSKSDRLGPGVDEIQAEALGAGLMALRHVSLTLKVWESGQVILSLYGIVWR